jgi:uncharacterized membrane protein
MSKKGEITVTGVFSTIGAILISLGVIWFLASNWHQMPSFAKILILVIATSAAYFAGYKLEAEHETIAQTMYMLTAILWTLSLFLIAQIFNLTSTFQANSNILLVALIGTATLSYLLRSSLTLVVAIFTFEAWVWLQTISSVMTMEALGFEGAFSLILLNQLAVTGTLFGLALLHRAYNQDFAPVYTWWAAFSIFGLGFWLSNQAAQGFVPGFWQMSMLLLLPRLAVPALLIAAGTYLSLSQKKISKFDAWSGASIWLGYIIAISILPTILGLAPGQDVFRIWDMSPGYIVQWLIFNVIYIALMLTVISFGTREKRTSLVYLTLLYFVVYIAARYIGFIADLSGYLAISTMFIIGGIGLIVVAYFLNKFRKHTLAQLR